MIAARCGDHLFRSNAVRTPEGHLSFVYKAAAEIGELGDNTAAMRASKTPGSARRVRGTKQAQDDDYS